MDDLIEAIRLEPKYTLAYSDRGFALIHNNRGFGYISLGEYKSAIHDFNEAVHLKLNT